MAPNGTRQTDDERLNAIAWLGFGRGGSVTPAPPWRHRGWLMADNFTKQHNFHNGSDGAKLGQMEESIYSSKRCAV